MKIRIIIADDQKFFLKGLAGFLHAEEPGYECFKAGNLTELRETLEAEKPHILFLDIKFGKDDARDFLKGVIKKYPDLKIIIISSLKDPNTVESIINAGVHGYILKKDDGNVVLEAIKSALEDKVYFSSALIHSYSERKLLKRYHSQLNLTKRQKEVIGLICDEKSTKEIAEILSISLKCVESHRSNLFLKLGVKNVAGLVKRAIFDGYL